MFSLDVGTCFDDEAAAPDQLSSVPEVDCAEPHDNEVYALVDHPAADVYPGDEAIGTFAQDGCLAAFDAYVGKAYLDSELDFGTLTPSAESWADGDVQVVCFLYSVDLSKLDGSMKGSAR